MQFSAANSYAYKKIDKMGILVRQRSGVSVDVRGDCMACMTLARDNLSVFIPIVHTVGLGLHLLSGVDDCLERVENIKTTKTASCGDMNDLPTIYLNAIHMHIKM